MNVADRHAVMRRWREVDPSKRHVVGGAGRLEGATDKTLGAGYEDP